jgi:hypothetical protein
VTPTEFIAKWRANTRNERAASQEHFLDLCALVSEPTPNSDPTRAAYAFEKGATKASGGDLVHDRLLSQHRPSRHVKPPHRLRSCRNVVCRNFILCVSDTSCVLHGAQRRVHR